MMGIKTEYNPELALRNIIEHKEGRRKKEECLPEQLEQGKVYEFMKGGQRNYWFDEEVPLVETKGSGRLSRPIASVVMLETTHFLQEGKVWTRGKYKVVEVFSSDDTRAHFDGFTRLK